MTTIQQTETVQQRLARLEARNAELEQQVSKSHNKLTLKVSPKKALSIYGLSRFPVTLYKDQWERVLKMADEINKFIREHNSELA
jgi:hypothetical protein